MAKKKFPTIVFITEEEPENDEPYFVAAGDAKEISIEMGETKEVAVYKLVEVKSATAKIEIS